MLSDGRCLSEPNMLRNNSEPIIFESPVLSITISSCFTASSSETLMNDSLSSASVNALLKKGDNDSVPISSSFNKLLGSNSR